MLVAAVVAEEEKTPKKRGLFGLGYGYGDYGHGLDHGYYGHDLGHHEHHTVHVKAVPVPYPVPKPYPVHVDRPYPVKVRIFGIF